jgi:flagellar biosynthesis/type III secretory pathway protein FliH
MLIRSRSVAGQAAALAQAGAERTRLTIEEEAQRLRDEGYQAGVAASNKRVAEAERRATEAERRAAEQIERARLEAEQRLGLAATALERACDRLSGLERQVVAAAEAGIVSLGLAVAAKVLAREVTTDPAWMRALLSAALADVPDRRRIEIRCAPSDAAEIRRLLPEAAGSVPGCERIEINDDASLKAGSLILVANGTRLDASVAGSWERLAAKLIEATPTPPMAMRDDGSQPEVAP